MKLKIDENLPRAWVDTLQAAGHDAMSVTEQGLSGHPDDVVASVCTREDRALVSLDADFANILRYPPERFSGIIVIRIADQSVQALDQVLERIVSRLATEPVAGRLWIVEKDRIRIRGD